MARAAERPPTPPPTTTTSIYSGEASGAVQERRRGGLDARASHGEWHLSHVHARDFTDIAHGSGLCQVALTDLGDEQTAPSWGPRVGEEREIPIGTIAGCAD